MSDRVKKRMVESGPQRGHISRQEFERFYLNTKGQLAGDIQQLMQAEKKLNLANGKKEIQFGSSLTHLVREQMYGFAGIFSGTIPSVVRSEKQVFSDYRRAKNAAISRIAKEIAADRAFEVFFKDREEEGESVLAGIREEMRSLNFSSSAAQIVIKQKIVKMIQSCETAGREFGVEVDENEMDNGALEKLDDDFVGPHGAPMKIYDSGLQNFKHRLDIAFEQNIKILQREPPKPRYLKPPNLAKKTEWLRSHLTTSVGEVDRALWRIDGLDRLTSQLRRKRFVDECCRAVFGAEGAEGRNAIVVFLKADADLFKGFNLAFTHIGGDVALQTMTFPFLTHKVTVGRVGGEEFMGFLIIEPGSGISTKESSHEKLEMFNQHIKGAFGRLFETIQLGLEEKGHTIDPKELFFETLLESRSGELLKSISIHRDFRIFINELIRSDIIKDSEDFNLKTFWEAPGTTRQQKDWLLHMFEAGSATMGFVQVRFERPNENFVSADDLREIEMLVNDATGKTSIGKDDFAEVFERFIDIQAFVRDRSIALTQGSLTYLELDKLVQNKLGNIQIILDKRAQGRLVLDDAAREASVEGDSFYLDQLSGWNFLIDVVRNGRLKRISDRLDGRLQQAKARQRGIVDDGVEETIHTIDHQEAHEEIEEIKEIIATQVKFYNHTIVDKLSRLLKDKEKLLREKDPRLIRLRRMERMVLHWARRMANLGAGLGQTQRDEWYNSAESIIKTGFRRISRKVEASQVEKYIDTALTFLPNDDFVNGIAPRLLLESLSPRSRVAGKPEKKSQPHFTIASLDFDNLKAVNEAGGYFMGDVVLRSCAFTAERILISHCPKATLARVSGGEEFVVVAPDTSSAQLAYVMKEINETNKSRIRNLLTTINIPIAVARKLTKRWGVTQAKLEELLGKKDANADHYTVYDLVRIYIAHHNPGKPGVELDKIGTVTVGVVDIADIPKKNEIGEEENDGDDHATVEHLCELSGMIGEEMKKRPKTDGQPGETYKGSVVTLYGHYQLLKEDEQRRTGAVPAA